MARTLRGRKGPSGSSLSPEQRAFLEALAKLIADDLLERQEGAPEQIVKAKDQGNDTGIQIGIVPGIE